MRYSWRDWSPRAAGCGFELLAAATSRQLLPPATSTSTQRPACSSQFPVPSVRRALTLLGNDTLSESIARSSPIRPRAGDDRSRRLTEVRVVREERLQRQIRPVPRVSRHELLVVLGEKQIEGI